MNLILLGPPGAGKGTQAALLSQRLGTPHVASGDLFREAMKKGTGWGKKARSYMERGVLVPDEVTNAMIEKRLKESDCAQGVILDGFPRTIEQARALEGILAERGKKIDRVLLIQVSEGTLIERLSGRRTCRRCQANYHILFNPPQKEGVCDKCGGDLYQRSDDREETVRRRFRVYSEETAPLIDHYRRQGLLTEIDGEQGIEGVQGRILSALSLSP
ncbi:MAG: adenylate kinase [Anaerolineae bacterium]